MSNFRRMVSGIKRYVGFLFLTLLLGGCIKQIDVDIDEEINVLVIDGFITTENGPHEIRITRSAKFGDIFEGEIESISGALVLIRDQTGGVVQLAEQAPGFYLTPESYKGEIGSSYTLLVETAAGEEYSSRPQTIVPVAELDEVFLRFKNTPTSNPTEPILGLEVFARFKDPADVRNFYLWEIDGSYRVETRPELYRNPETGQVTPKPCCAVCYIQEDGVSSQIFSDIDQNGNDIVQKIGFIRDNGLEFTQAYQVAVRHYSIGRAAFEFNRVLRNQLEIEGSIFDPPPATIGSNIINLNDPKAPTIGYFGAFDVKTHRAFVDLSLLVESAQKVTINDDCRLIPNSSTIKPSTWN